MTIDGVRGTRFAVWAPNAGRVAVIGDFNAWDARRHPMRLRHSAGVWELFIPRVTEGARYKFDIVGAGGYRVPQKADPLAQQSRGAARHSVGRGEPGAVPLARRRMDAHPRRAPRRGRPALGLRGSPRLLDARRTRRRRILAVGRRDRPADPVPHRHGLHACGAAARSQSIRSADRGAISRSACLRRPRATARRKASRVSSTRCTLPASASSSTGCRRIFQAMRTGSHSSTAPRSTSIRIRAKASIRTGTR